MKIIFQTIEQVKTYVPRLTVTKFESIREFIVVGSKTISTALGAFYEQMIDYSLTGTADPDKDEMVTLMRRVVSCYTMFYYVRSGGGIITAQGNQMAETDTNKIGNYADKMDIVNYYAEAGDSAMDTMLQFCTAKFPAVIVEDQNLLVRNSTVYTRFVNIGESRRTYLALLPELKTCEEFYLSPLLGITRLNDLRQQVTAGIEDELIKYCKAAVCHYSMSRSIGLLTLRLRDGSIGVASFYSPTSLERQALESRLLELKTEHCVTAKGYLDLVTDIIRLPEDNDAHLLKNSAESKHFVVPYLL